MQIEQKKTEVNEIEYIIKPIENYMSTNYNEDNNILTTLRLSLKTDNNSDDEDVQHICIKPENYGSETPLDQLRNNCLVNLSDIAPPKEAACLLQLGERFGLPLNQKQRFGTTIEFIKNIENNIFKQKENQKSAIRNF